MLQTHEDRLPGGRGVIIACNTAQVQGQTGACRTSPACLNPREGESGQTLTTPCHYRGKLINID